MRPTVQEAIRNKISVFVISYNREAFIATCLKAVQFADEVILIDKGSVDKTVEYGAPFADRVIRVPWSPTVEGTRNFALSVCNHDWILYLDDDELLGWEAVAFIREELCDPRADIYCLPSKHYILGTFEKDAYYWPECHPRFFKRGAIEFTEQVHGGAKRCSEREYRVPIDGEIAIHHLSHSDVHQWVEKANRYTDQPDRVRMADLTPGLAQAAHLAVNKWMSRSNNATPGSYVEAVAVLRALYDIMDGLKEFEERRGIVGKDAFSAICRELETQYERGYTDWPPATQRYAFPDKIVQSPYERRVAPLGSDDENMADGSEEKMARLRLKNDLLNIDNSRWQERLAKAEAELEKSREQLDEIRSAYQGILNSRSWRYTRVLRSLLVMLRSHQQ